MHINMLPSLDHQVFDRFWSDSRFWTLDSTVWTLWSRDSTICCTLATTKIVLSDHLWLLVYILSFQSYVGVKNMCEPTRMQLSMWHLPKRSVRCTISLSDVSLATTRTFMADSGGGSSKESACISARSETCFYGWLRWKSQDETR